MIVGVGTDIVEIKRIKKSVEEHGEKFLNRIFTQTEIDYSSSKKNKFQHLAARFAAKEAIVKALAKCCDNGFNWKDIEIYNDNNGAPQVRLFGKFADYVSDGKKIEISLSHSEEYAVAFAVLFYEKQ